LKIIFAGTPPFAAEHLKTLLKNFHHEVVCIYTQPDRPSGRGRKKLASPVKKVALDNNLAVRQPNSLNNSNEINFLKECLDNFKSKINDWISSDTVKLEKYYEDTVKKLKRDSINTNPKNNK